jgi:hypothetical protein
MQFLIDGGAAILVALFIGILKGRLPGLADIMPLLALIIGVILSVLIGFGMQAIKTPPDFTSYVLTGVLIGLTAVGGYELTWDKLKSKPTTTTN